MLHDARALLGPESLDLKQRRACLSFLVSSLMANGRQQKKVWRQRNQTMHLQEAIAVSQKCGGEGSPLLYRMVFKYGV
uniref:Uncharacterized protein n=1 Tax=Aegilops tauschii subsp. strangulata TaxID=200361 RepID=A0A453SC09_AEGTS